MTSRLGQMERILTPSLFLLRERFLFHVERKKVLKDLATWRSAHPLRDTDADLVVTFFVPIFERRRAPNWDIVEANLLRTVEAVRRQTDNRWRLVVCSQDRPEQTDFDDQVQFLRYPVSHAGKSDKTHKLRFTARYLARNARRDGYAFFLDGDDIPHPSLVQYILEDNNGQGYYLPQGYCFDAASRTLLAPLNTDGDEHTFAWLCGSSHAVRFDTRYDASQTVHISLRGDHMKARQNLKERVGLNLQPVPFPAMIYIVNHGSSDQDILSRQDGRKRATDGLRAIPNEEVQARLREFALNSDSFSR